MYPEEKSEIVLSWLYTSLVKKIGSVEKLSPPSTDCVLINAFIILCPGPKGSVILAFNLNLTTDWLT